LADQPPAVALRARLSLPPVPTELGRGSIDYSRIFAAAKKASIRALFVEQEPPFADMPVFEAIKVDYEFMKNFKS